MRYVTASWRVPLLSMIRTDHTRWVLHDYLQVNGGAERLVVALAGGLTDFELGVSGVYPGFRGTGDLGSVEPRVLAGPCGILPRIPRALLTFANRRLTATAESVLYSGIYAPLAVKWQQRGRKLMYCHTPPRFAFDRESDYLDRVSPLFRPGLKMAIGRFRAAYLAAVGEMDQVVTNSQHVRERLLRQAGIDSLVVHPPIDVSRFRWRGQGGYYLSVGRLEPAKRVDRIVEAFRKMPDKRLIVASGGTQLARLKRVAAGASNIRFTGWVDRATLVELVGNAIACLYVPEDEDFGMSAVEAMAAGKPVISVDEGGLRECVVDGETGILVPADPPPGMIADAVERMDGATASGMRAECEAWAQRFSNERFLSVMERLV